MRYCPAGKLRSPGRKSSRLRPTAGFSARKAILFLIWSYTDSAALTLSSARKVQISNRFTRAWSDILILRGNDSPSARFQHSHPLGLEFFEKLGELLNREVRVLPSLNLIEANLDFLTQLLKLSFMPL